MATAADHGWIRQLSAEVYRELGDYGTIIGSWLDHPGVLVYLDEVGEPGARHRRGFILLGFHQPADLPGASVADLLAIAVDPACQRQGIGSRLLEYAIHLAEVAARTRAVPEIRLTVADTNPVGQKLFRAFGFAVLDPEHGAYDGGQRAIRMSRPLGLGPPA